MIRKSAIRFAEKIICMNSARNNLLRFLLRERAHRL